MVQGNFCSTSILADLLGWYVYMVVVLFILAWGLYIWSIICCIYWLLVPVMDWDLSDRTCEVKTDGKLTLPIAIIYISGSDNFVKNISLDRNIFFQAEL